MPPYSDAQVRLFSAAAHNPEISKRVGIPQATARKMEMEAGPKQRSKAMSHAHRLAQALTNRAHS